MLSYTNMYDTKENTNVYGTKEKYVQYIVKRQVKAFKYGYCSGFGSGVSLTICLGLLLLLNPKTAT